MCSLPLTADRQAWELLSREPACLAGLSSLACPPAFPPSRLGLAVPVQTVQAVLAVLAFLAFLAVLTYFAFTSARSIPGAGSTLGNRTSKYSIEPSI